VSEFRFYDTRPLICPHCGQALTLEPRKYRTDSMKLVHPINSCQRSGKQYYRPGVDLQEMPPEFQ
jgi:hypothetical protein